MKIGKIELTQEKLVIATAAAIVVSALGVFLIFYAPLMKKLQIKYLEYKSAEKELRECRSIIETMGKGERVLIAEEDISHAIDELTRHGKVKGINFISMSPERIEKSGQYKVLPVKMEIKSDYEELGIFLGSLDDLEKGLVRVKSFDITPNKEDPSRLMTKLVVETYLSGK